MGVGRDLRTEIIEATWRMLRSTGFEGFKVQQVIKQVGASTRAFYHEFEDKDALFVALMQDEYSRSATRLGLVVAAYADPVEQIGAWVRELILAAGDPRRAARARLFASRPALMHQFPEAFEAADQLLRRPLVMAVLSGRDQGVFTSVRPETDAELFSQLAGASMTLEATIAEVVDFALRALGHPSP
jgi:AcrR family transcriptional regulator